MKNKLILLSEFQPLHRKHEEKIIQATQENIATILFCIDGAYRKNHADSPFTTQERETMIHTLMQQHALPYSITYLRDSDNDDDRIQSIKQLLGPLSGKTIISDDVATQKLLIKHGFEANLLMKNDFLQSTIRNQFAVGNHKSVQKNLPPDIYKYLMQLDACKRMKDFKLHAFWTPNIATDTVIVNDKGEIAIIDRLHEPFGAALPGGMIDRGELGEETAAREAGEEAGARGGTIIQPTIQDTILQQVEKVAQQYGITIHKEIQPFIVQTSPTRDPRGHIMTLGYVMKYNGELKKGSDAKSVQWMKPEVAVQLPRLAKPHRDIILSYITQFLDHQPA